MITLAESKVLDNIRHGFTVKETAKLLSLSPETVKSHKASLMLKLDARNSAHMVYKAMSRGLISILAMLMSISAMGQTDTSFHWLIEDAEPITDGETIKVVQFQQPCDVVGCAVYHNPDIAITGYLKGTYVGYPCIIIEDATCDSCEFIICNDNYNPNIWLWGDSCISDDEWVIDGWDAVIQDSSDFYSQAFLDLCENNFHIFAEDDCEIDTFGVTGVIIQPPGGVDRPSGVREFYIQFSALDATGKMTVEDMLFRRTEEFYKCD